MKLWEIKAQALRLMFADTDINFDESEFQSGKIYDNPNTREKLVRMNDSIMRAIDLFYQYNGEMTRTVDVGLFFDEEEEEYKNLLDCSELEDFGFPTRVDIVGDKENLIWQRNNIEFMYDRISKRIFFTGHEFERKQEELKFRIYYRMKKFNIPHDVDEMEFDLESLYIPEEVQRQIPKFVKFELFEEDEPQLALAARSEFIEFLLLNQRKNFGKTRSKVRRRFPWGSE